MVETGWWRLDGGDWMVETGWWRLDAEVCMKNENENFCNRLQCAKNYWQLTEGQSGNSNDNFWKERVEPELAKVLPAATTNDSASTHAYCKDNSMDSANRAACQLISSKLEQMYQNSNGSADPKNYSDQIIKCVLLREYAKKLKEKAKEGGFCSIDEGIKKAFENARNGKSVPCQWNEGEYENCSITTSGSSQNEEVKEKVKTLFNSKEETQDTGIQKTLAKFNENNSLCERVKCAAHWWEENNKTTGKNFWDNGVKPELEKLFKNMTTTNSSSLTTYCSSVGKEGSAGREACLLFAEGLEYMYKSTNDSGNAAEASFKRTMMCAVLNAYAKKVKEYAKKKGSCEINGGIDHALGKGKDIMNNAASSCGTGTNAANCFECTQDEQFDSCSIKTAGGKTENVKNKLEGMLDNDTTGLKESLDKICGGQCKDTKGLCGRVECVKKQWLEDRGTSSNENEMWTEVQKEVTKLDSALSDNGGSDGDVDSLCAAVTCTNGATDCVSKRTCKSMVKSLKDIHQMKENGSGSEGAKLNDRIFRSTMRCVALNALAEKLKQHAKQGGYACAVEKGIKGAFAAAGKEENRKKWCNDNGKGDGSCEECKEQKCISSTIENKNLLDEVMKKLNDGTTNTNIQFTLSEIKRKVTLCDRLQCLASRVQLTMGNNRADDFWGKEGGEVAKLWKELSQAMTDNGGQDKGGQCGTMDDGSGAANGRPATDPERKACNYLHAGFERLKTTPKNGTSTYPILSTNPLLRQTVGCLLLKEYAKKMKGKSTCVIDSGIEKAFKEWNEKINKSNGQCKDGSACIECKWDDNSTDTCPIATSGSTKESAKEKLKTILPPDDDQILTTTLTKINHMDKLCDYIKCAAPNWFKSKLPTTATGVGSSGTPGTPTKTWCDFWGEEGVKKILQDMFQQIEENGKGKPNRTICQHFGDGNEHSVERKACNYIIAGLKYVNDIKPNGSVGKDNPLLHRAVGCIALNLYADQIIEGSQEKCPIHESKIEKMFILGNAINNNSCLTSGSGSNNNVCFECTRYKDFKNCDLLVDKDLIGSTASGGSSPCNNDNDKNKEVPTQMKELLDKESNVEGTLSTINKMTTFCSELQCAAKKWNTTRGQTGTPSWDTLSTITNMNNSFCTQLQCAAKQYYAKRNGGNSTGVNWETLSTINKMDSFCSKMQCAAKQYHTKSLGKSGAEPVTWDEIKVVLQDELEKLLKGMNDTTNQVNVSAQCDSVSSSSPNDTKGEITAKQKACKLFASGLKHISDIKDDTQNADGPLKRTMMCAALNLYADQLIKKAENQCPLDNKKLDQAIEHAFQQYNATMKNGTPPSCPSGSTNSCFICNRGKDFHNCRIGNNPKDKVKDKMEGLLEERDQSNPNSNKEKTLEKINQIETFCTQVQCAIKQHYRAKNGQTLPNGTEPSWKNIEDDAMHELKELLEDMMQPSKQKDVEQYCSDNDAHWYRYGHKKSKTNKAACLLFASGLKHIYGHVNARVKGPFKGPSFEQTMGCLFLKEYAKQLQTMANEKKKGHSWVHPLCEIDKGIKHAFNGSEKIMKSVLSECSSGPNGISCFVCTQNENDYKDCSIGSEKVQDKVKPMFEDDLTKQTHLQQTLENTVCPILLTDLLTPFLPLAPVSIGLSAMAYYLWKYFGPLGKGGARFRRSPAEIRGPSVQEQVLDHVQEAGSHEYRLVKERKPRSAATRTKRSGPVNRRTIIEIHFEVLDECQKGDTQLNQKDFLELLVREFMGSEFMEEEQVPKEDVFMEGVPMELVPIEEVPSLGSGLLV
ncbi:SICAvar, type I [Plasmodium knowlesi strain H]|uniref:SICAvar, type I n=1 Tax=Plasmodium knowlesi (strain H) TaxID=5851 RepID=A0A1A7VWT4_PLAKH|nr:SICAvar, type I [Plasmodium knowlesi strain H]SBO26578.1 SICAvar, type I [Plasmodium knowlesi strain H]